MRTASGAPASTAARPRPPPGRRTAKSRLGSYLAGYDGSRAAAEHRQRHRRQGHRRGHRPRRDALSTKEHRLPHRGRGRGARRLDAGVTLIDTADAYSRDEAEFGHNEELVANALRLYAGRRPGGDQGRRLPAPAHPGAWTGRRRTSGGPARARCGGCTPTRSGCTSCTGRTRRRRGKSRWAASDRRSTTAWCAWSGSRTPTSPRSTPPAILGAALVSVQNQFSPGYRSSAVELDKLRDIGLAWRRSPFGGVSAAEGRWTRRPRLRGGGRRARRLGVPGDAGLAPRSPTSSCRSRGPPPGVDHRLRRRDAPDAHRRATAPARRTLTGRRHRAEPDGSRRPPAHRLFSPRPRLMDTVSVDHGNGSW